MSGLGTHGVVAPAKSIQATEGAPCPLSLVVTAGQRNDAAWLERVLDEVRVPRLDRAYSYKKQRQVLRRRGIGCISPERLDAKKHRLARGVKGGRPPACDAEAYKGHNVVERCINRRCKSEVRRSAS
jgi:hypothetical protein